MNDEDEHPQRYALVNELHARPSPRLRAPCTAVYLAIKEPRDAANRDRRRDVAHLAQLCARHGAPRPDTSAGHYTAQLGRHQLRWESHTEFVTYAAFAPGLPPRPFDPSAGAIFPEDWQHQAPGKRIAAAMIQVDFLPDDPAEILPRLSEWFAADSMASVWVLEEAAVVAGDFRIDPAGWMRFALFVRPDTQPGRIGRIVQRLLDLETYRAMSMLGLGRARDLTRQLNALDPQLSDIVQGMSDDDRPADAVLQDLLSVSTRLESAATQHAFRFGANAAYEAIVMDRVASLRETRFMGGQMLTEFMARRYLPAMRTAKSAEKRLSAMLDRSERAGELLRTRVDVQRSAQNQELMQRMDRRADLQLRLQHTVEGLSVVAISYYAVGLLGYALYPLAQALHIDKAVLVAALTPVAVLGVWLGMRRIRARLHDAGH
ncbi:DUF3422 domain-containing protein (plasmid) [Paracoccus versutus]|uniref:Membrane-anchored protein n=1 Tax=Paracoccus versutus TaxID=34007 RepID=A0AAQ0HMJ4_PARVE|nr:DUF3422 domain-containing protein [Paracoccus versutus]KGJ10796.1 hypothetical protein IT40_10215 [Paracoccus versutus]REG55601.1 putative membrane-anchored protein [Paracoccus versutus]WEJ81763.1 DUF3422 domain-containing protein [Paracoccus versutus]